MHWEEREIVSEKELHKLSKHIAEEFSISAEEALEIMYEEWDLVETLFEIHIKVNAVKDHFFREINDIYRIA